MTNFFRARTFVLCLPTVALLAYAAPARAQYLLLTPTVVNEEPQPQPPPPALTFKRPPLLKPFTDVVGDLRRVPTLQNVDWLVAGMGAAIVSHAADRDLTRDFAKTRIESFKPGAIVGGTPLELGAAFATYAIGRASNNRRAMAVGGDLIRAQLVAEIMTTGVKQAVRRARPQGTGFSFPSGHTAVTFASATVFQQHFGWKAGLPAYAVATYVAASRVQMKRHFLSDVVFGASVGIVAGRTVSVGGRRLMMTPIPASGGGGIGFTWLGKR